MVNCDKYFNHWWVDEPPIILRLLLLIVCRRNVLWNIQFNDSSHKQSIRMHFEKPGYWLEIIIKCILKYFSSQSQLWIGIDEVVTLLKMFPWNDQLTWFCFIISSKMGEGTATMNSRLIFCTLYFILSCHFTVHKCCHQCLCWALIEIAIIVQLLRMVMRHNSVQFCQI